MEEKGNGSHNLIKEKWNKITQQIHMVLLRKPSTIFTTSSFKEFHFRWLFISCTEIYLKLQDKNLPLFPLLNLKTIKGRYEKFHKPFIFGSQF